MHSKYDKIREIREAYRNLLPGPDPEWPPWVRRVVLFIHIYLFDSHLTVGWLREQCHITLEGFSGKFKYHVGRYPRQYWVKHRIEASKLLLRNKDLKEVPILTIAISIGFDSQAAFSMTFKNHVGIPPGTWRENESDKD